MNNVPYLRFAHSFSRHYPAALGGPTDPETPSPNPLQSYFQTHKEGRGIWKWNHYFEIYQRHFSRFVGTKVNVLEVGVAGGGSLEMWRSYFGKESHIYGVDIDPRCKKFSGDRISVSTGDQADREFWRAFRDGSEGIDILIDDGGHRPNQQQVTLEEMLPYLRPGGVYLCEDIHGHFQRFGAYATGLVHELNRWEELEQPPVGGGTNSRVSHFQSLVHSVHFYPYVVVIEKHRSPLTELTAPKHGTEW